MIHEIGLELAKYFKDHGVPVVVVDGPEPTTTATWGHERVVLEHDDEGSDSFSTTPRSQHRNPRHVVVRNQAMKATIYTQSNTPGARVFEHRRRGDLVLDQVLGGLKWIAADRKNACTLGSGHFIVPENLEGTPIHGGAVYELKFTFERGVPVTTFKGEIQPEAAPGAWGIHSTTKVSQAHGPDNDANDQTVPATAETACGA